MFSNVYKSLVLLVGLLGLVVMAARHVTSAYAYDPPLDWVTLETAVLEQDTLNVTLSWDGSVGLPSSSEVVLTDDANQVIGSSIYTPIEGTQMIGIELTAVPLSGHVGVKMFGPDPNGEPTQWILIDEYVMYFEKKCRVKFISLKCLSTNDPWPSSEDEVYFILNGQRFPGPRDVIDIDEGDRVSLVDVIDSQVVTVQDQSVTLDIWEEDGFLTGDDDHIDILTVNPYTLGEGLHTFRVAGDDAVYEIVVEVTCWFELVDIIDV